MQVATAYAESSTYGGRPLLCLQIDRDQPGMDIICSQRNIVRYPTIQIMSRGQIETVQPGDLEKRLLELGVASKSRPARRESGFGGTGSVRAARATVAPGEVDFFGVGSGGAELSQGGIDRAMASAPKQGYRKPAARKAGGEQDADDPPPVEALELDADGNVAPDREAMLDKLFGPGGSFGNLCLLYTSPSPRDS